MTDENSLDGEPQFEGGCVLMPRAHDRRRCSIDVAIQDSRGGRWVGKLLDLSEEGCRVELPSREALKEGRVYSLRFAGLEAQVAFAAWSSDGSTGLRFTTRLDPAIVDNLASRFTERTSRRAARARNDHPGQPLW